MQDLVSVSPISKLCFHGSDDFLQRRKVSVVDALTTREFPNPLDRIQFGTIGRRVVQHEILPMVVSPFFVKPGMMVSGVVRNDHDGTAAPDTRAASHLQEGKEGHRVEFARFPEKTETFHLATAPHQSILRCGASDDATARGPWSPMVPIDTLNASRERPAKPGAG